MEATRFLDGLYPGVIGSTAPWLNPKAGKLFRMAFAGHSGRKVQGSFVLDGSNIIQGFSNLGYSTIGSGAVIGLIPLLPLALFLLSRSTTFILLEILGALNLRFRGLMRVSLICL